MITSNHQKFLNIIDKLEGSKPTLLLHVCCAPCLAGVISRVAPYFDLTLYYYNPNIMPRAEYDKRYKEIVKLLHLLGYTNVKLIKGRYNNASYKKWATELKEEKEGGNRCHRCIAERIAKTAEYAKANNYDYYGTTLSVSPHKDASWINTVGENLSKECNLNWLYADFKKADGYLQSTRISKELGIYRQEYCGCKL